MDKKLFLVDAYALIYRAYFAFMKNPLINSKGFNTSPVMGFFRVIDDVLDNEHPTHLAVAFDGNVRPFRFKIYDQYKAQREKTPEDILEAVPVIKQILQAYRIPILEVDSSEYDEGDQRYSYEADDIIGTISHKAAQLGYEVYMLTPDKDYASCLTRMCICIARVREVVMM
jgi:DNA polymerase-1